jgi:hypothetical protein
MRGLEIAIANRWAINRAVSEARRPDLRDRAGA